MTAAFSMRKSRLARPSLALKAATKSWMEWKDAKSRCRIVISGLGPASGLHSRNTNALIQWLYKDS